jgi:hypothetical protein
MPSRSAVNPTCLFVQEILYLVVIDNVPANSPFEIREVMAGVLGGEAEIEDLRPFDTNVHLLILYTDTGVF